ncbi:hypothetical protein M433DRAFT_156784 [Acidomyces richmondensis BFW]|nr:MAG: hypothetical protein FE78DRAFT_93737 [Acidomyces sp. 'richmondensis']KYG43412.1 hypothetical protein M433DRAFT_156784 [Acidomyces richmondensis BFW]
MAKDHWSAEKYASAAGFVPKLTNTILSWLDCQPNDTILDIGCGDGQLTVQIAEAASNGQVLGLDASRSFISTAQQQYSKPNCTFKLQDCTTLSDCPEAVTGRWDKVFSNAAMHWILRNEDTRLNFFHSINKCLRTGGKFVFEMGGKGNVAEIQASFTAALLHIGFTNDQIKEINPWFFPSVDWMYQTLVDHGFEVERCELEYRPTKLNPDNAEKTGGIEGWVRLMGAQYLEAVNEIERDSVVKEICDVLDPIMTREEDGSKWIGYTRLRAVARKQ